MKVPRRLGVLGGMGPLATADFLRKLIEATPAACDQEHIPVIVHNVPQVPDRAAAIVSDTGESPLAAMLAGIETLQKTEVEAIATPCNTAHFWYPELSSSARVPMFHIADVACDAIERRGLRGEIGILGTPGTLQAGFFQQRLADRGFGSLLPSEEEMRRLVRPCIAAVKGGDRAKAFECAVPAVDSLIAKGAVTVVLACTELPVALEASPQRLTEHCVDTVAVLAEACVRWAMP